jgi:hypothetical protein
MHVNMAHAFSDGRQQDLHHMLQASLSEIYSGGNENTSVLWDLC